MHYLVLVCKNTKKFRDRRKRMWEIYTIIKQIVLLWLSLPPLLPKEGERRGVGSKFRVQSPLQLPRNRAPSISPQGGEPGAACDHFYYA